ncbi:uncharacterized protein G2W53_023852 [Senna tora]|uniref:Uncharacterized protein n=1 Tax=Senna tora TaxID=362788 RepID=A0A834TAP9_9FABA|nr:uncharacterized protein G2W53_023852 [Senna tora]
MAEREKRTVGTSSGEINEAAAHRGQKVSDLRKRRLWGGSTWKSSSVSVQL